MLNVKALTKKYQRGGQTITALDKIDLQLADGEFLHIIGHSGSGKSTLLSLIAGLLSPDVGEINIAGTDFGSLPDEQKAVFRNKYIGVIPQMPTLISSLTVFDNIAMPCYLSKKDVDIPGRVWYLLSELGVQNLATAMPHTLSGGEIRRVLIARALMMEPQLILADEPTADLDPQNTREVMDLFQRIHKQGTSLIVVTHEHDTLNYGDRVLELIGGHFKVC